MGHLLQTPGDSDPYYFLARRGNFQFLHSLLTNKLITRGSLHYTPIHKTWRTTKYNSIFIQKKAAVAIPIPSPDSPSKEIAISNGNNARWEAKKCYPICWRQHHGVFLLAPGNPHALKWRSASLLILGKRPTAPSVSHCSSNPTPSVLMIFKVWHKERESP